MASFPQIRVNVPVRFPAQVIGSGPITLVKQNGMWRVGLDYTVITNMAPVTNDFPSSYLLYYSASTGAYFTLTLTDIIAAVNGGTIQIVTDANPVTVDPKTTLVILNKAAPSATQINLPAVGDRNPQGLPLEIFDFKGNGGDITIDASGAELIMGSANPWIVGSGGVVGSGGKTRMIPNSDIGGWCAF